VGARRWTLTALLPPRLPVAPEDRRAACYRRTFRGERSYGFSCGEPTTWKRVGGTIFAFGALPARVQRVRVVGPHGVDVRANTARARGDPLAAFYAAPLPPDACDVVVLHPDRRGAAAEIGPTGPVIAGSPADRRRCGVRHPDAG
jgi:hypothetical protein